MDENEKYMETRSHRKQEMKFSKEICKQCYKAKGRVWSASTDKAWKDGWVRCWASCAWGTMVRGRIPMNCPNKLEHTVLGKQDETQ